MATHIGLVARSGPREKAFICVCQVEPPMQKPGLNMLVDARTKLEMNNLPHCFKTFPLGAGCCSDSCSGALVGPRSSSVPVPGPHPLSISRPVVVISRTLPRNYTTTVTAAKPSRSSETRSVSGLDQVVCERLDRRCGVAGLRVLTVVADENGLGRLDNDDSCPSLYTMP